MWSLSEHRLDHSDDGFPPIQVINLFHHCCYSFNSGTDPTGLTDEKNCILVQNKLVKQKNHPESFSEMQYSISIFPCQEHPVLCQ